jgi:hypothetical protein
VTGRVPSPSGRGTRRGSPGRAVRAAALLALVALASSCADEAIPLATIPATDGGATPRPTPCINANDCPADSYCSMASCSDAAGVCKVAQIDCIPPEAPVCGCDNITYFNDCLRQAAGIRSFTPGQCEDNVAARCGGPLNGACPDPSQRCARLERIHGPCPHDLLGTCWVLPSLCPPPGTVLWDTCDEGPQCVDTCTAIRSGVAYERAAQCP